MTLPAHDTTVTYPAGELVARATVLHTAPAGDGLIAVITDTTPFHPVDAAWPDQPADAGTLRTSTGEVPIRDAVVAATDGTDLHLGGDIPVRKGTEGWVFVVAHLVDAGTAVAEGDQVEIEADAATRRALSLGHTACHAASLALNRAVEGRWSKPARTDALGRPDFDGIAIASSRIEPFGSVDRYRLNKSLRRAGFDAADLADGLDALADTVSGTVGEWIAAGSAVRVEREGDGLTDRRSWVAELPGGTARIACGGTHADSLAELGAVRVEFELVDDAGTPVLEMRTRVDAAS
ncbi:metal-dependent hydrolase [Agromyces endophyticus]|uniref:metal-dependent hydrolase n=1 Tax=Agromyces sp. H17E-10 TaxID=2932244 RepID=UPI001FD0998D|nr:metal-dependent hydrolase [Agromyces sp. H17E-10]UOQ88466.1 metal-dependent hydrolase [Agromyces sp. H17E-10]